MRARTARALPPPIESADAERLAEEGDSGSRSVYRHPATWIVGAAAVLIALFVWLRTEPPPPPSGPPGGGRPTVAIGDFHSLSGQALPWLETTIAEMLRAQLTTGEQLRVVSGDTMARARQHVDISHTDAMPAETLAELRRRLGADYVVFGTYLSLPGSDNRMLTVQVQDTRTGVPYPPFARSKPGGELLLLVADAATAVRQYLEIAEPESIRLDQVATLVSSDLAAGRSYAEGLLRWRGHDVRGARHLFLRAVEADPSFAVAHMALAEADWRLGDAASARDSAARAFELRQGLPRDVALRMEGRYYQMAGQSSKAVDVYQDVFRFLPDSVEDALFLVEAQVGAGLGDEAGTTLAALRALPPPLGEDPRIDLAASRVAEALGDPDGQLSAAGEAFRKSDDSWLRGEARHLAGRALAHHGRTAEALGAFEEARRLFADAGDAVAVEAVLEDLEDASG